MFDGYLEMGGTELVNVARTMAYLGDLAPEIPLVRRTSLYDTLQEALGDDPYTTPLQDDADWVSPDDLTTEDFYGLYPLSIDGIGDSTMTADQTEGVLDGGFVNAQRSSMRTIRVRGVLLAKTELALEAGLTWLRNALTDLSCGTHIGLCGYADLRYLLAKPPADDDPDALLPYDRFYHRVKTTVGVAKIKHYRFDCGAVGLEVDFEITAENPHAYATGQVTRFLGQNAQTFVDGRSNLIVHPNAEYLASFEFGGTTSMINLVTNPRPGSTTGYTAIAGTGGTAANTLITNYAAFGHNAIRTRWSVASSAGAAGVSRDVAVTALSTYSFLVDRITTDNGRLTWYARLEIEWRTASATISSVQGPVSEGTIRGTTNVSRAWAENVTAPATATIARVKVLMCNSSGSTSLGISGQTNSSLYTAHWFAILGKSLPWNRAYWDGASFGVAGEGPIADASWSGTDDASTSSPSSFVPPFVNAIWLSPGYGAFAQVTATDRFGLQSHVLDAFFYTDLTAAIGATTDYKVYQFGYYTEAPQLYAGVSYRASVWVYSSKQQRLRLDFSQSVDQNDNTPRTVTTGTPVVVAANTWTRISTAVLTGVSGQPYGRASLYSTNGTGFAQWTTGDFLRVDDAMVSPGADLYDYFDGSYSDDGTFKYAWSGAEDDSISYTRPSEFQINLLNDPLLGTLVDPPAPPEIDDVAISYYPTWTRQTQAIPDSEVAEWASDVPSLKIRTNDTAVRQLRVRFYPNPHDIAATALDGDSYCAEYVVSYIPPYTTYFIDGVSQAAYGLIPGQASAVPGDQNLYLSEGSTAGWAELSCGLDYIWAVELPSAQGAVLSTLDVELTLNRRE